MTMHFVSDWNFVPKGSLLKEHTTTRGKLWNEQLAERIRAYWASHGFDVNVWVEKLPAPSNAVDIPYCIKSDLINGLPQGVKAKAVRK